MPRQKDYDRLCFRGLSIQAANICAIFTLRMFQSNKVIKNFTCKRRVTKDDKIYKKVTIASIALVIKILYFFNHMFDHSFVYVNYTNNMDKY